MRISCFIHLHPILLIASCARSALFIYIASCSYFACILHFAKCLIYLRCFLLVTSCTHPGLIHLHCTRPAIYNYIAFCLHFACILFIASYARLVLSIYVTFCFLLVVRTWALYIYIVRAPFYTSTLYFACILLFASCARPVLIDYISLTNILKVCVHLYILNCIFSTILFNIYIFNSTPRLHFSNWSFNSSFILQSSILQLSKMIVLMWTLEMEFALFTSMLESVRNGLQAKSVFKKEVWKTTVGDIKKMLKNKRKVIVDQLKTKFQWYKMKLKE